MKKRLQGQISRSTYTRVVNSHKRQEKELKADIERLLKIIHKQTIEIEQLKYKLAAKNGTSN